MDREHIEVVKFRLTRFSFDEQTGILLAHVNIPAEPGAKFDADTLKDRVVTFDSDDELPFEFWKVNTVIGNNSDFFGGQPNFRLIFECVPVEFQEEAGVDDPFLDKLDRMIELLESIDAKLQ